MLWAAPALLVFLGAAIPALAAARTPSVAVRAPKPFGVFLGDVIRWEAEIAVEPRWRLDEASLPRPGRRAYWLELRAIDVSNEISGGVRRWRIALEYQTFHAPLQTTRREIPAFAVTFADGGERLQAEVPAWSFLTSPLREINPPKGENRSHLRDDAPPALMATTGERRAMIASGASAALALLALAYARAWPPFHRRRGRPFAQAARQIRRAGRAPAPTEAYAQALLALHRAFNAAAQRCLLADDLEPFLSARPALRPLAPEIARFFAASRAAFFGEDAARAMAAMPLDAVLSLCRRLRAAERRAP